MQHPTNPILPQATMERVPACPIQALSPLIPAPRVSAPVLGSDPDTIPIGQLITLNEVPFEWDGTRFRNGQLEATWRADHGQRVKLFVIAGVIMALIAWAVLSGLDWDAMTLEERDPYKWAGRIAVFIMIAKGRRIFLNSPQSQFDKTRSDDPEPAWD